MIRTSPCSDRHESGAANCRSVGKRGGPLVASCTNAVTRDRGNRLSCTDFRRGARHKAVFRLTRLRWARAQEAHDAAAAAASPGTEEARRQGVERSEEHTSELQSL